MYLELYANILDEEKKIKNDQYLRELSKGLQIKNKKKKQKINEIKQNQEEEEKKVKKEYRKLQNAILQTIIHFKNEDYKCLKKRTAPATCRNNGRPTHSESCQQLLPISQEYP